VIELMLLAVSDRTMLVVVGYVAFLVSLTFHEASHALVAYLGGDRTAYEGGQVSLNPIPHIRREPFGTVIMPLGIMLLFEFPLPFGYASTPVDTLWAARNPRRAAVMSFAGPAANFLLAAVAFVIIKLLMNADVFELGRQLPHEVVVPFDGSDHGPVFAGAMILSFFLTLNIILGILNLIPVPPLDGASVVEGFFPRTLGPVYQLLRSNSLVSIILFVLIFRFGAHLIMPPLRLVVDWLR
jgi:Zn-dependent protease